MVPISSSFKDNSGFVFKENNVFYRTVNNVYSDNYKLLLDSGLYKKLINKKLFLAFEETTLFPLQKNIYKILKPTQLPVISYAYEWSFSMLKDAAICTLKNCLVAMENGMILKDANTFNIQFLDGKPILIDSLSFEKYDETKSWVAYRQFCESFIAPLVLMKYTNANLNKLLIAYPNGIPLEICKSLLPIKAKFNFNIFLHIVLPSKYQNKKNKANTTVPLFNKQKLNTLIIGLLRFVQNINLPKNKTVWDNYYTETILNKEYLDLKKQYVKEQLNKIEFNSLLDLGANDGEFCMPFANSSKKIIALDFDENCIERLYNNCKKNNIKNIYPLINNLASPTPAIGWQHQERDNISDRIKCDVTLALALIHHLAIANNIPLQNIISYFHTLSPYLIIEFVSKDDEKVKELLQHRQDIFDDYNLENFISIINPLYETLHQTKIGNQHRWLFLLKRK